MDSMSKQAYLFVGALAVLVVVVLVGIRRDGSQKQPPNDNRVTDTGKAVPSSKDPKKRAEEMLAADFPPSVQGTVIDLSSLDAPKEIEAKALKLTRTENGLTLQFTLYSSVRCMEGDLDIIRAELRRKPSARMLFTIEPLFEDSPFEPIARPISIEGLESGLRFSIPIAEQSAATHLALFICSDSENSNSCRTKKVEDLNQILERYESGRSLFAPEAPDVPEDKVYFFQYFLLEHNSITAFKNEMEINSYDQLAGYLSSRLGSSAQAKLVAGKVMQLNQTIRSASAEFRRNRIRLDLPRSDSGKCEEEGLVLPPGITFSPQGSSE